MIEETISQVEEILGTYADSLGDNYLGYRNHVYRLIHFCLAHDGLREEDREKIIISACFHDLGIWTSRTFDYIPPSIVLATNYLECGGLDDWVPDITLMIGFHHKLRQYNSDETPLVEVFRTGDMVDLSLGVLKCGLSRQVIREVRGKFPNAGFHSGLARVAGRWFFQHPLNPIPVLKW